MARRNHPKRPIELQYQHKPTGPGCHLQLFFCVNALLFALTLVYGAI